MRGFCLRLLCGALAAAAFAAPAPSRAGAWDTAHMFDSPERNVETLVVTGNYVKPRMIADLVQSETRAPYILLPAAGDSRIFLCLAKGPAIEVRDSDLSRLISYLNPQRIVIVGDSRFVPDAYRSAIEPRFEVVKIESDNWYTNAVGVANLLERPAIEKRYRKYAEKLDKTQIYADEKAGLMDASPSAQIAIERARAKGAAQAAQPQKEQAQPTDGQAAGSEQAPLKPADAAPAPQPPAAEPASGEPMTLVPPEPELVKPAKKPSETVVPK